MCTFNPAKDGRFVSNRAIKQQTKDRRRGQERWHEEVRDRDRITRNLWLLQESVESNHKENALFAQCMKMERKIQA